MPKYLVSVKELSGTEKKVTELTLESPETESEIELYIRAVREVYGKSALYITEHAMPKNLGRLGFTHGGCTNLYQRLRIDTEEIA